MKRRLLRLTLLLAGLGFVILLLSYEIIGLEFADFMEDQPAVDYKDAPHRLQPAESIPYSRPRYATENGLPLNPVPADSISLKRGTELFARHCSVCHGTTGAGDGAVTQYWKQDAPRPANLTAAAVAQYPDGYLYEVIRNGVRAMPPLRENLDERQRWDTVNHVKTLQPKSTVLKIAHPEDSPQRHREEFKENLFSSSLCPLRLGGEIPSSSFRVPPNNGSLRFTF